MTRTRLDAHIAALDAPEGLKTVLTVVAATCAHISKVVAGGALAGALGASGQINVQDEEQKKLDVNRAKDFRRNLTIAIVGAVITGAFAIYAAYMAGHENGHDKGVADTLQAVPVLAAPAATTTAVLAPAAPASAPATVAPASKK